MKNYIKYIFVLWISTSFMSLQAQEEIKPLNELDENQILDQVVAVVGKEVILKSDIETQYLQFRMQGYIEGSSETIKCDILKDLIFKNYFSIKPK